MRTKYKVEKAREAWDYLAREEGYQCIMCGAQIEYDDREVYIRTGGLRAGKCGNCAHKIEKNDQPSPPRSSF